MVKLYRPKRKKNLLFTDNTGQDPMNIKITYKVME